VNSASTTSSSSAARAPSPLPFPPPTPLGVGAEETPAARDELLAVGDQRQNAVPGGLTGDRLARVGDEMVGPCLLVTGAGREIGDDAASTR